MTLTQSGSTISGSDGNTYTISESGTFSYENNGAVVTGTIGGTVAAPEIQWDNGYFYTKLSDTFNLPRDNIFRE